MPEIETDVAPMTFHCNVEDCPEVIEPGFAVKLVIAGRLIDVTVTVAEVVTEP